jgi:rubrerythrin
MDPIVVVIVVLLLGLIASVSYKLYRKVRVARAGPPKSLAIQRSQAVSDKPKAETRGTKVIGMINCEYCGSLIPQTEMTCPNCGASRRK